MHRDEPSLQSELPLVSERAAIRAPLEREVPVVPVIPNADLPAPPESPAPAQTARIDAPARQRQVVELRLRAERGDTTGALAQLDKLVSESPDDVDLLCERATLLTAMSRFDRADADVRRALRLDERHPGPLLAAGLLACKRARWRDAIEPLRAVVALTPDDASAHYYLGEAYNHIDELPPALAAFERATALDPRNWRALKGVGMVLDRLGRREEATEAHRRAREIRAS
jgi:Flp pilus assembly protein TadD